MISSMIEEQPAPKDEKAHKKQFASELFLIGKLLEKSYINITDVEHAQFFIKEMALKIDQFMAEKKVGADLDKGGLCARAEKVFTEMETKKAKYFEEGGRELGEARERISGLGGENERQKSLIEELTNKLKEIRNGVARGLGYKEGWRVGEGDNEGERWEKEVKKVLEERGKKQVESKLGDGNFLKSVCELQSHQKSELEQLSRLLSGLSDKIPVVEELMNKTKTMQEKENNLEEAKIKISILERELTSMNHSLDSKARENRLGEELNEETAKRQKDEIIRLKELINDVERQLAVKTTELNAQNILNAALSEETARLRTTALSDKESVKELYLKIEAKSSEIQELIKYKEKVEYLKEENTRLVKAKDKLEAEYLQFHSELKKLKDRMKMLIQQNDELLNEKLFYETKVDRLEARLAELAYKASTGKPEDPEKLKAEIQKLKCQNRKLAKSFNELSPLNDTIRKLEVKDDEENMSIANQMSYKARAIKESMCGKICP